MYDIDATHDPKLKSWVDSANSSSCDFPIQNLPFGRFKRVDSQDKWKIGVAIGDQVLDLRVAGVIDTDDMNVVMGASTSDRRALRHKISEGLRDGSPQ